MFSDLPYFGDLVDGDVPTCRNVALEDGATPAIHGSVRRVHSCAKSLAAVLQPSGKLFRGWRRDAIHESVLATFGMEVFFWVFSQGGVRLTAYRTPCSWLGQLTCSCG